MRPWAALRCRFNHDWLKNQYLLGLSNWIDLLEHDEDERRDVDFEQAFITETLPQWQRRRLQAVEIANGAIAALSPQRLFERPPLDRCPTEIQVQLAELAHRLWLTRSRVRDVIAEVEAAIVGVDEAFEGLNRHLSEHRGPRTRMGLRSLRSDFVRLRDTCRWLAETLERLGQVSSVD
jgi:hypothetical protein